MSVRAPSAAAIPDGVVRHRLSGEDAVRWTLVAIFAAILYLFLLYPLGQVLWRSLLDNDGHFIGVANYVRYFSTPAIAASITNSLFVSVAAMGVGLKDGAGSDSPPARRTDGSSASPPPRLHRPGAPAVAMSRRRRCSRRRAGRDRPCAGL